MRVKLMTTASFLILGTALGAAAAPAAVPAVDLSGGAVLFTFDDAFVREWVAALPIFAEFGARATFFVTRPDRLDREQLAGLHKLAAAGHAIGCHGFRHRPAVVFVKAHGMSAYLEQEILPANRILIGAGFQPTCFAYPSSQHNGETDAALLKIFRHLRTGTGLGKNQRLRDLDRIFVPVAKVAGVGCLIGTGIDYAGTPRRPDYIEQVCEAMDRARKNKEIVVFYAHNISADGPGHHLAPAALRRILAHAREIGLPAVTYDDLP